MATESTQKKIERVQRAGVKRRAGQRRPLGFGALVVAIIVVGTALVLLARDARNSVTVTRPIANEDTWFAAFGIYVCDAYLPDAQLTDVTDDHGGIRANGDGLIRIQPTKTETAGTNAVIGQFFNAVGLVVADDGWTHTPVNGSPDSHKKGDSCDVDGEGGEPATTETSVRLLVFPPQSSDKTEPEVLVDRFNTARLNEDGKVFVLALLPNDADPNDVPLPTSVQALDDPNDTPPGVPADSGDSSTTTAPEGVTTTVPGATTTTAPGATTTAADVTTTTVAPTTTAAKTTTTSR